MNKAEQRKVRKRIAAAMRAQGRKWAWLAEQTHYSRTQVTDMMHGRATVSERFAALAYNALGLEKEVAA